MRLRNDNKSEEILNNNQQYFLDLKKTENIECLKKFIKSKPKFYLEIGMGKGQFIINNALNNLNINYLGLEKNKVICAKAIKKILNTNQVINNLKITNYDAKNLLEVINPNSVNKIFLNFSDPWPKKRHTKNRLTHPKFLMLYKDILTNDGIVELKTDNDDFFNYTLEVLHSLDDVNILYSTTDLHNDLNNEWNVNNIETEYEMRFKSLNKNINKVVFNFNK